MGHYQHIRDCRLADTAHGQTHQHASSFSTEETVPGIRVIDARRELSGQCLLCIFDTTGRPVKFDLYSLRQRKRSLTGTIRRLVSLEDPQQDEGRGVDPVARRGSAPAGLEKGVQRLCVSRLARKSHG
jgi:hypothetical protein